MRALLGLLLAAACSSSGPLREIERNFVAEREAALVALPSTAASSPTRAGNAPDVMERTAARALRFLESECESESEELLVRALLACARLIRGENAAARDLIAAFPPGVDPLPGRGGALLDAARHALGVAEAAHARADFEALLAGRGDPRAFLETHGRHLGLSLPLPGAPLRDELLASEVERLRAAWFPEVEGDPRGLQRSVAARRQLRRTLAEQLYDDAAALLHRLEAIEGNDPVADWLAVVAASSLILYAHQMPDLLPEHLSEEQKQWLGEQAASAFRRTREAATRFASEEERKRIDQGERPDESPEAWPARRLALYAALVQAEAEAMGWIRAR
ncbi:MAG: hypothetical protein ACT4PV_02475 [Planctomycetaceae bacterium]